MKTDVEDQLPPKVEKVLHCDMSALQKKMYHNMRTRGVMTISSLEYDNLDFECLTFEAARSGKGDL
jgi:SNF2 family DNA or RNA helicase